MGDLDEFFNNADVFDAFDEDLSPTVTQRPSYQIDMGFDHKENLLKKSSTLGLYRALMKGDANHRLPFEDESFNSLFSNIVYWLDDPMAVLAEIGRVLRPGGQACLMLPNSTLPEFSFYNQLHIKTGNPQFAFLEKLDRGRFSDNIRQARSAQDWEDMFASAHLRVRKHVTHLSSTAIQIWDIGLRPLFPVLQKMAGSISPEALTDIKWQWIATFHQFLAPIVQMDEQLGKNENHAFHCYILEK
jgi:SAM-dependent methyltransferase